jgi:hypothetical protein
VAVLREVPDRRHLLLRRDLPEHQDNIATARANGAF